MSESECHRFCSNLFRLFSNGFKNRYIKPLDGVERAASMKTYSQLGLPGCIGSINATFIKCGTLPESVANLSKGEKGKGLLFNVIVDHSNRVLDCQRPVLATINDKIIYNGDDVNFTVRVGPQSTDCITLKSCYVIADGGYLNKRVIFSAFPNTAETNPVRYKFHDWIAIVRKDVECFFGILKQRFRYLKNPNNCTRSTKYMMYLFAVVHCTI